MIPILRSTLCSLVAGAHRVAGRVWFKVGNTEKARGHFERVLELKGDDFVAYVYLGRLAYCLGDYAGWRREYEHARRTAPERYARLKNPFDLFEPRSAGTIRDETGERATWRTVRLHRTQTAPGGVTGGLPAPGEGIRSISRQHPGSQSGPHSGAEDAGAEDAGADGGSASERECPTGTPLRRYGDDFSNDHERSRFRALPPIDRTELEPRDLDRLIDELTRDQQ